MNKRATQQLALPIRAALNCTEPDVHATAQAVCEAYVPRPGIFVEQERLWFIPDGGSTSHVMFGPPSRREPGKVRRQWHARVTSRADGPRVTVTVELTAYLTKDQQIVGRDGFIDFRERLLAQLLHLDPSMTVLAPIT